MQPSQTYYIIPVVVTSDRMKHVNLRHSLRTSISVSSCAALVLARYASVLTTHASMPELSKGTMGSAAFAMWDSHADAAVIAGGQRWGVPDVLRPVAEHPDVDPDVRERARDVHHGQPSAIGDVQVLPCVTIQEVRQDCYNRSTQPRVRDEIRHVSHAVPILLRRRHEDHHDSGRLLDAGLHNPCRAGS